MESTYITVPNQIYYSNVVNNKFCISASQYKTLHLPNENYRLVRDFLYRELQRSDLGKEVGSLNYIEQSTHYFLRTKALQEHSFLPEINKQSLLPIMPNAFIEMNLKEGDLLISKDSNIGEMVILDKHYPNTMLSGAIYKLPIQEKKYYLLAFIKHNFFREQLDLLVPKGATIRHAKTTFLDCKIPLPNHNTENTIKFIERLTQAIINKEILIRKRHDTILEQIEKELLENQKPNSFEYKFPTYKEMKEKGRLDTNLYSKEFKEIEFLIKNYKEDYIKPFNNFYFSSGDTPNSYVKVNSQNSIIWISNTDINKMLISYPKKIITNIKIQSLNFLQKTDILFSRRAPVGNPSIFLDNIYTIVNEGIKILRSNNYDIVSKIFFICFLETKYAFKQYKTGSGSIFDAVKNEDIKNINVPNFPKEKQQEIASLYHNPIDYETDIFTLDNFLEKDHAFNQRAGIYELDKTAKRLKEILNQAIDDIINDREVEINF